jgi:hypothetical protein
MLSLGLTLLNFGIAVLVAFLVNPRMMRVFYRPDLNPRAASFLGSYAFLSIVLFPIFVVCFTLSATGLIILTRAEAQAEFIKQGRESTVVVRYRSFTGSAGQVTKPGLVMIGATQKAYIFYDVDDEQTLVIPQAQMVSIEIPEQDATR